MKNIDISILKEKPSLDMKVQLTIEPLAPLSMVAELPGSYYKSLMHPSKKMICGLFENILGWHFDINTRMAILKDLKKIRKRQKIDADYKSFSQGSTYVPLLMEYFELGGVPQIKELKSLCVYDDYWSKSYRRADSHQHINGIRFMDADTIPQYIKSFKGIDLDNSLKSNVKNQEKTKWFQKNIGKFAQYYSSPTIREFMHIEGSFVYDIRMNSLLFVILSEACRENNLGYLGTNEGWINLKISKS